MTEETKHKVPGLFDVVDDLSDKKKHVLQGVSDAEFKKAYNPYMINRAFSMFLDTIMLAAIMNRMHWLDLKQQHDFYFHGLDARRRRTKWPKADKEPEELETVATYYGVSRREAQPYVDMLTPAAIREMKESLSVGGS